MAVLMVADGTWNPLIEVELRVLQVLVGISITSNLVPKSNDVRVQKKIMAWFRLKLGKCSSRTRDTGCIAQSQGAVMSGNTGEI